MRRSFSLLAILIIFSFLLAQNKKPLDHSVYELWNFITYKTISDDGKWVGYTLGQDNKDGKALITHVETGMTIEIQRGDSVQFAFGNQFAIVKVHPPKDSIRKAKLEKKKKDLFPKDSLYIINLKTNEILKFGEILSVKLPEKNKTAVGFLLKIKDEKKDTTIKKEQSSDSLKKKKEKKRKGTGNPLHIFVFENQKFYSYSDVTNFVFNEKGTHVLFAVRGKDSLTDGISYFDIRNKKFVSLFTAPGKYPQLTIDRKGIRAAFLRQYQKKNHLYFVRLKKNQVKELLNDENKQVVPEGWRINPDGALNFSRKGERLYFGLGIIYPEVKNDSIPEDEKVKVDIWHYKDPYLQPMQLKQAKKEKKRSYKVLYDIDKKKFVRLADLTTPDVQVGEKGDGKYVIAVTNIPYRMLISWDYPPYYDVYRISLKDGSKKMLLQKIQSFPVISPSGRWLAYWDRDDFQWKTMDVKTGKLYNVSYAIPEDLKYFLHDWPYKADSYGAAGWSKDEKWLLINGKYDIWAVDPMGKKKPFRWTGGFGEEHGLRLRYIPLNKEENGINLSKPQLLYGFHYQNKQSGYFQIQGKTFTVKELIFDKKRFSRPIKAKKADIFLYTREDFKEFPDLWVSDWNFKQGKKISNANPQQKDYLWGDVQMIHWTSLDGKKLDGLLYTPEGFDPSKKYPMMVYFYEKNSDNLYRHWAPQPHRSIINFTFYVSRGYLVFVPDIYYQVGYPGKSAVNCVLPGVTYLIEKGFVDEKHIGVQGHSWGGYQIAYLVTQTDIFAAAEAGAPVSDMFSAYGGIRWGSGMSRMFQYEKTQSRIGKNIWNGFLRYLENSPLFWVEKIKTPLLMMHNDHDGAVPWYQGIEMFVAMRRLGKPAWMINYNNQPHWPVTYQNRKDWAIRMQQFFDHFLKGAPAPRWLKEGIPAVLKGTTLGYELEKEN